MKEKATRRSFLKASLATSAAAATGAVTSIQSTTALSDNISLYSHDKSLPSDIRASKAAAYKIHAAKRHFIETTHLPEQRLNNDERRYRNDRYIASFSKTLPCNDFGEVHPHAFRKLRRAMRTGIQSAFDAITLDPQSTRKLANPQGAFRFEICGLDSHATRITPSFKFRSADLAAQQAEVYWQAHTRDVPFISYNTDTVVADAIRDLNAFSRTPGATDLTGNLNSENLFRGETPGDLVGPYISQFLLRPFNWGPVAVEQKYRKPVIGNDFMLDEASWLNVQRGAVGETVNGTETKYIYNNRALAEAVHNDALYQYYLHATLILLGTVPETDLVGNSKFDPGNPYANGEIDNQGSFTSMGGPNIIDLVSKAGNTALSGAWFQKWRIHRVLRPEALAGRVHFHKTGQRVYELHPDLLDSEAVNRAYNQYGSYFLAQAYPEGSPIHPSYVAGHACVAGACVTVLKACFNEDYILESNVQADTTGDTLIDYTGQLTVGDELNKLANNISLGRDAAGVHYRQDGIQGLQAGEQQAIALLQETSRSYNESNFDGFFLRKFNGDKITIRDGRVI